MPTKSAVTNLVILLLSSEMLGNDAIVLLGEILTEDAKFNKWCATSGKLALEIEEISRRSAVRRDLVRIVFEAWVSFSEEFEAGGRKVWVATDGRQVLKDSLGSAKVGLSELRNIDS